MTTRGQSLRDRLRAEDPWRGDGMTELDVRRMRHVVLAAAHPEPRRLWGTSLILTAAMVALVCLGVWVVREPVLEPAMTARVPATSGGPVSTAEVRQMQFLTPGGTRVIWVFDASFEMR